MVLDVLRWDDVSCRPDDEVLEWCKNGKWCKF